MNKGLKIGLIILGVIIVGFITVQFKTYYNNTYVGSDYYVKVPSDQDTTIEEWKGGQYDLKGRRYKFTAYNENGEARVVEFDIYDVESEENLLQPNTYLKVNSSKNRVISWKTTKKQDIPEAALKYINENHK